MVAESTQVAIPQLHKALDVTVKRIFGQIAAFKNFAISNWFRFIIFLLFIHYLIFIKPHGVYSDWFDLVMKILWRDIQANVLWKILLPIYILIALRDIQSKCFA